jgi:signal transduction histidine kinase
MKSNSLSDSIDGPPFPKEQRQSFRRAEDRKTLQIQKEQNHKLQSLLELGRIIGLDLQIEAILQQIAKKTAEIMDADRCTIYLHNSKTEELWSTIALGLSGQTIRMSDRMGIAGYCFHNKKIINLMEAYSDPRFNQQVDEQTGYHTKSLLSMPLHDRGKKVLGVIQVLNKNEGTFTSEDEAFLQTLGNQAAVFLEMAQLQQARFDALEQSRLELKRLNQVKDKALDHLSHELRTPLSVIQGNLRGLKRKLGELAENPIGESHFITIEKHLDRLLQIQRETDKIIRSYPALEEISALKDAEKFYERLARLVRIPNEIHCHWQIFCQWLRDQVSPEPIPLLKIPLHPLVREVLAITHGLKGHRSIEIELEEFQDMAVFMAPDILKNILLGLLKNAVENTPDEGKIRISVEKGVQEILLVIEDFGVGITEENQKSLFEGLFHTQETDLYSSKTPYNFNAGGKGLFLLQAKIYGQRFGFDLIMESRRCRYIPRNSDLCPGRISDCNDCRRPEDCLASGGSIFSLSFPLRRG